jgi:hypothetical protein
VRSAADAVGDVEQVDLGKDVPECRPSPELVRFGIDAEERHSVVADAHGVDTASALHPATRTSGIDQNAPHHPRGRREEVRPVVPVDRSPIEQPEVRLLHQLGGLPAAIAALIRQDPACDVTELLLDEGRQSREGVLVTVTPRLQKTCQIRFLGHPAAQCTGPPAGMSRQWERNGIRHAWARRMIHRRAWVHQFASRDRGPDEYHVHSRARDRPAH